MGTLVKLPFIILSLFVLFSLSVFTPFSVFAQDCNTPIVQAPNLFQINTTGSWAQLNFSPVNDTVSYYYISYGYSEGDERFGVQVPYGNTTGVISYTLNDLTPNTTYFFKVRAGNDCAT